MRFIIDAADARLIKITNSGAFAQSRNHVMFSDLYQNYDAMKTLLIPVDFSDVSEMAIDFGLQLASKCGYRVILHHSVDYLQTYEAMYMDSGHVQSFAEQIIKDMEDKLDNLYRRCDRDDVDIQKQLTTGSMIHDIRELVEAHDVDLIVMGTRGASGLKEFFVGSNTEKVVRLVKCPVISVPKRSNLKSIRRILVPVEIRDIRPSFLKEISKLQQLFSASVEFCYVKTPHDMENEELIEEEFNQLLNEYEIASSSFRIIKHVFPEDGLLSRARDSETDMVAMATHSRRGLAHFFTGSLTEDVMNHLEIPMWSFKINASEKPLVLEKFQEIKELN